MTMREDRMKVVENKISIYGLTISTFLVIIVNCFGIFANYKSTYCCSSMKTLITSILVSSLVSTTFCYICSAALASLIYLKSDKKIANFIHGLMNLAAISAQFIMSFHIFLISLQRYIAVIVPLKIKSIWVVRKTKFIVAFIWISIVILCTPLIVIELITEEKYKIESKMLEVQHCLNTIIIVSLVFFYTHIIYLLYKAYTTTKPMSSNATYSSKSFKRSVIITIAMGSVFCITYIPRSLSGLIEEESRFSVPIFFYVASYFIDPIIIIVKYMAEKRSKNTKYVSYKSDSSVKTDVNNLNDKQ